MRRRLFALALCAALLTGCGSREPQRYETTLLTVFDTVTTIVGYAESEAAFQSEVADLEAGLLEYHQLFDIYNDYEGLNNLKTVNDAAGGEAVKVDGKIIELLLLCRELCDATGGRVDVTMGAVLSLWHDAREAALDDPDSAALPDDDALQEAAQHRGFDYVEIDQDASTVRITDPDLRLDVGAVAKGYATERVCETAPEGYLVSVGGNVKATGAKPDGTTWTVGVQNPGGGDYLQALSVTEESVVSSGDYQRYFTVDGRTYHHIIDPDTLYPGTYWRAVTVVCEDSGIGDGLSTALFLMTKEDGEALLERYDAEALWVAYDGTFTYSDGFGGYVAQ
jgi:thiamine biosynthesis lipoprotein